MGALVQPSDITSYLELDDKVSKETVKRLLRLDSQFHRVAHGDPAKRPQDDDDQLIINTSEDQLGTEALENLLEGQPPADEALRELRDKVNAARYRVVGRRVRANMLSALARSYIFGVTDFLRLRVTASYSHIRYAVETAAFMKIMSDFQRRVAHRPTVSLLPHLANLAESGYFRTT